MRFIHCIRGLDGLRSLHGAGRLQMRGALNLHRRYLRMKVGQGILANLILPLFLPFGTIYRIEKNSARGPF